jgi:OmpA-OmpF porin, OOP family
MQRLITALVLLALAAPALAQRADEEPAAPSWANQLYLGVNVGKADWRPGCPSSAPSCDDSNTTLGVFAGYEYNRILSAEVAFTNLGKITFGGSSVKATAWEASALAMLPAVRQLPAALRLYGKLGAYRGNLKSNLGGGSETNTDLTYGAGAQYEFAPNIAARAEWQRYPSAGGSTLPKSDIDVWRLGALWRFR